jgi:hypothetical protein
MKYLKHIERFNESDENLNTELPKDTSSSISDVSESDFILNEFRTILKKREEDMLSYIKEYFTQDEINTHSENLLRMVEGVDGDIAEIKMKLLGRNHHVRVKHQ